MRTKMETRPCPSCERGTLMNRGGKGRCFPHRIFRELELPEDVELPTCDHCEKIIFNPKVAAAFDEGLSRAYQAQLSQIIAESLSALTPGFMTQQDLERSLGLSRGYISKLKGGKESSPVIAGLLGLLSVDPQARLKELEELWAGKRTAHSTSHSIPVTHVTTKIRVGTSSTKSIPSGRRLALAQVGT